MRKKNTVDTNNSGAISSLNKVIALIETKETEIKELKRSFKISRKTLNLRVEKEKYAGEIDSRNLR